MINSSNRRHVGFGLGRVGSVRKAAGALVTERLSGKEFFDRLKRGNLVSPCGKEILYAVESKGASLNINANSLPQRLYVMGDLTISSFAPHIAACSDCRSEYLKVDGTLTVSDEDITALPERLRVRGLVVVMDCLNLERLPSDFKMFGDRLVINGCPKLREISDYWKWNVEAKTICIKDCLAFESLPAGFTVNGDLELKECPNLTMLPSLKVAGGLFINDTGIVKISDDVEVGSDICLLNCKQLEELPKKFHVRGDLVIVGCARLPILPEQLWVEGDLILKDCPELDMPAIEASGTECCKESFCCISRKRGGMYVRNFIQITNCPKLISKSSASVD